MDVETQKVQVRGPETYEVIGTRKRGRLFGPSLGLDMDIFLVSLEPRPSASKPVSVRLYGILL